MPANRDKAPSFFVEDQLALMISVLDRIIPPGDGLPGAGELSVVSHLDSTAGGSARLKRLFSQGLHRIEAVSRSLHSSDFAELGDPQKDEVLRRVETEEPDFFNALIRETYIGYYTDSGVVLLLGMEARPPQPTGHALEPGDLSGLEKVRARGRIYREA